MIGPVLLPTFAEAQDDKPRMCRGVLKTTMVVSWFGCPSVVIGLLCGETILSIVYRPDYSAVAVAFGLLCIHILFLIQGVTLSTVYFSIGQPGKHRAFVGLRTLILMILIYPAIREFGVTGAAGAVLLANITASSVQVIVMNRTIDLSVMAYLRSWLPGVAFATVLSVILEISLYLGRNLPLLQVAVGILSYLIICPVGLYFFKHGDELCIAVQSDSCVAVRKE